MYVLTFIIVYGILIMIIIYVFGEVAELVEGARLELVCALIAYRGFEPLSLRHLVPYL